jgi:hypothetical protein
MLRYLSGKPLESSKNGFWPDSPFSHHYLAFLPKESGHMPTFHQLHRFPVWMMTLQIRKSGNNAKNVSPFAKEAGLFPFMGQTFEAFQWNSTTNALFSTYEDQTR